MSMNPVWNWIYADVRHGVVLYSDGVDLAAMTLDDSPTFISSRLLWPYFFLNIFINLVNTKVSSLLQRVYKIEQNMHQLLKPGRH